MKKEHFEIYRDMILRCIDSCVMPVQLMICWDMMERFKYLFASMVESAKVNMAMEQLLTVYHQKYHELDN